LLYEGHGLRFKITTQPILIFLRRYETTLPTPLPEGEGVRAELQFSTWTWFSSISV
jgi:hypothetical protein